MKEAAVCRVCLTQEGVLLDLFGLNASYAEDINRCLSVKVEKGDGLPSKICIKCVGLITDCRPFVENILKLVGCQDRTSPASEDSCYYCLSSSNYLFPIPEASIKKTRESFDLSIAQNEKICHRCQFYLDSVHDLKLKACASLKHFFSDALSSKEKFTPTSPRSHKNPKTSDPSVYDLLCTLLKKYNMATGGNPNVKPSRDEPRVSLWDIGIYMKKDFSVRGIKTLKDIELRGKCGPSRPLNGHDLNARRLSKDSNSEEHSVLAPSPQIIEKRKRSRDAQEADVHQVSKRSRFGSESDRCQSPENAGPLSKKTNKQAAQRKKPLSTEDSGEGNTISNVAVDKADVRRTKIGPKSKRSSIVEQSVKDQQTPNVHALSAFVEKEKYVQKTKKLVIDEESEEDQKASNKHVDAGRKKPGPKPKKSIIDDESEDDQKATNKHVDVGRKKTGSKPKKSVIDEESAKDELVPDHQAAENQKPSLKSKSTATPSGVKPSDIPADQDSNHVSSSVIDEEGKEVDDLAIASLNNVNDENTKKRKRGRASNSGKGFSKSFKDGDDDEEDGGTKRMRKNSGDAEPSRPKIVRRKVPRERTRSDDNSGLDESTASGHGSMQVVEQPDFLKALDELLKFTPKTSFKPFICSVCHEGYVSTVKGKLHKLVVHDPHSNVFLKLERCDDELEKWQSAANCNTEERQDKIVCESTETVGKTTSEDTSHDELLSSAKGKQDTTDDEVVGSAKVKQERTESDESFCTAKEKQDSTDDELFCTAKEKQDTTDDEVVGSAKVKQERTESDESFCTAKEKQDSTDDDFISSAKNKHDEADDDLFSSPKKKSSVTGKSAENDFDDLFSSVKDKEGSNSRICPEKAFDDLFGGSKEKGSSNTLNDSGNESVADQEKIEPTTEHVEASKNKEDNVESKVDGSAGMDKQVDKDVDQIEPTNDNLGKSGEDDGSKSGETLDDMSGTKESDVAEEDKVNDTGNEDDKQVTNETEEKPIENDVDAIHESTDEELKDAETSETSDLLGQDESPRPLVESADGNDSPSVADDDKEKQQKSPTSAVLVENSELAEVECNGNVENSSSNKRDNISEENGGIEDPTQSSSGKDTESSSLVNEINCDDNAPQSCMSDNVPDNSEKLPSVSASDSCQVDSEAGTDVLDTSKELASVGASDTCQPSVESESRAEGTANSDV